MRIHIKGADGRSHTVEVDACDTIDHVREEIWRQCGEAAGRLMFSGKQLESGRTLSDYNIQKESTLHIINHSLRGNAEEDAQAFQESMIAAGIPPGKSPPQSHTQLHDPASASMTAAERAAGIVAQFKLFDANANGVLEKCELEEVLTILTPDFTSSKFEALIEAADLDRNGTIDLEEFVAWAMGSDLDTDAFRKAVREIENPTTAWAKAYKRSLEIEAERVRRKAKK